MNKEEARAWAKLRLQVEHLKHANYEAIQRAAQREIEAQALREELRRLKDERVIGLVEQIGKFKEGAK